MQQMPMPLVEHVLQVVSWFKLTLRLFKNWVLNLGTASRPRCLQPSFLHGWVEGCSENLSNMGLQFGKG